MNREELIASLNLVKGEDLMGVWIFTLPETHAFRLGGRLLHDAVYRDFLNGMASYDDLITADNAYYSYMKGRAAELEHDDPTLLAQAHLFYDMIVTFRLLFRSYGGFAPMPPS